MFSGDDLTDIDEFAVRRKNPARSPRERISANAVFLTTAFACAATTAFPHVTFAAADRVIAPAVDAVRAGPGVTVQPEKMGRALRIMRDQKEMDADWTRALAELRASGANVDEILKRGTANIETCWGPSQDIGGGEEDET